MAGRRLPGWLVVTGWVLPGVAAVGLPVALTVAALDVVRRDGGPLVQGLVLGALVLLAVVLVLGAERGLAWIASEVGIGTAAGAFAGIVGLVLLGVFVPGVGLVLVAVGVVLGVPLAFAGVGLLAWWRWQYGPRPVLADVPDLDEVRARGEVRRAAVRARHEVTREAVARGYVGPGFTEVPVSDG